MFKSSSTSSSFWNMILGWEREKISFLVRERDSTGEVERKQEIISDSRAWTRLDGWGSLISGTQTKKQR
jgi:hypothetical protein